MSLLQRSRLSFPWPAPREVSPWAVAAARRLLSPLEQFLHVEAASGLVLFAATIAALALAHSPWAPAYAHWLEQPFGFRFGERELSASIHFWINDGLMTIFFFVIGLEIRREIHEGELSRIKSAVLPVAAALGGMVVPALLYLVANSPATPGARGWGIPMATDIAFALGVLALLGRRVPPALRVLLLAVAIVDDIGSIVVLAVFYSGPLRVDGFLLAGAGILLTLGLQRIGARAGRTYVVPGLLVWLGVLRAGVHPTIAGVVMGLLTPARAWLGPEGLVETARRAAWRVERKLAEGVPGEIPEDDLEAHASELGEARREALAPAVRLQRALHPWVAFGVMPVFALANAGVSLRGILDAAPAPVAIGIGLGLVLGKPVGILVAAELARRTGLARLPHGVGVRELSVLGVVAGVGFTMALFVAGLAFADGTLQREARQAIVLASGLMMVLGYVLGLVLLRKAPDPAAAPTATEAERSDER